jgi:hypothetical protein
MAKPIESVDISNAPDLLRLAEEVRASKTARVLRRDDEDIAVIVPIKPRPRSRPDRTSADREAFLSAAGRWQGLIDVEEFKEQIANSRGSSRAPVDL